MQTQNPAISVVIPAFKRRKVLLNLLADLQRQTHSNFEVIVVEDVGNDGTIEEVHRCFPSVKIIQNEVNSGPAVSRNNGILQSSGSIILGIDSDVTIPDPDLLKKVETIFFDFPCADVLAFRILTSDGSEDDLPRWCHPLSARNFSKRSFNTSYFSGTAFAVKRISAIKAGLFPTLLYMDYEEVQLSYYILDMGGQIIYRPDLIVHHHANPVSLRGKVQVFYTPRNQILMAVTCLPVIRILTYLPPRIFYQFLKALTRGYLLEYFRAMKSAISIMPQCLQQRRVVSLKTIRRIAAMRRYKAD